MATSSDKRSEYDFSGIVIDELVAKPLVAVAIAQSKMAHEQVHLLLRNCFYYDEKDHCYRPKVIKMTLTRGVLEGGDEPDAPPKLEKVVTHFHVPLITIFPFAALGIDIVNIDFDLEVTAQYTTESQSDIGQQSEIDPQSGIAQPASNVEILGKVAPQAKYARRVGTGSTTEETSVGALAAYSIEVTASPMSLTKGLLSLIELYTNAIEPWEMPEDRDADTGGRW